MNVLDRFLNYVTFDTQSDEESATCPSTDKQKVLGAALVEEMKAIGIADAFMDENGYVYGTVPGDPSLPTIGLIAHMDTAGSGFPAKSPADLLTQVRVPGVGHGGGGGEAGGGDGFIEPQMVGGAGLLAQAMGAVGQEDGFQQHPGNS